VFRREREVLGTVDRALERAGAGQFALIGGGLVVRRVRNVLGAVDGALKRAGEQVNSHSEGVDWL
jgi:hypothetical protein